MGFQLRGKIVIVSAGQKKTPALYEKSGKLYYYLSMFHQNNTIKSIKLGIVESLSQNSGAPLVSKNV